ncbi:MAG: hypothetical protein J6S09_01150, partial [Paludibacteraceae bacterium]|nr:hypothetical protein [Paludibacteraceae bacterium]
YCPLPLKKLPFSQKYDLTFWALKSIFSLINLCDSVIVKKCQLLRIDVFFCASIFGLSSAYLRLIFG